MFSSVVDLMSRMTYLSTARDVHAHAKHSKSDPSPLKTILSSNNFNASECIKYRRRLERVGVCVCV